ncbi:MAG: hypothetical protein Q4P08_06780, partial [Eubacteriales bacterium]|nr:hypothetical protein [Eubacteriales bacterium]
MKKKVIIIVLLLIVVGIVYFVGSGFKEQKSVALRDFTVSEDGNEITMRVELNSSIGHVRSFKDKGGAEKP